MRCKRNVTCSDPSHTVHYEFEYFDTEYGYDKLYVNDVVYEGNTGNILTNKWIDSFTSQVDLFFYSDYMVVDYYGFKMNLKCDTSSPTPTSIVPDVTYEPEATLDSCYFENFGDSAVFDTGEPYSNNMRKGLHLRNLFELNPDILIFLNPNQRCYHTFACNNSNEAVHMKFERFHTEYNYDFLIIGDPDAFETTDVASMDYLHDFFQYDLWDYVPTGKALILEGFQPTDVWATAASIQNFDIYFHRMVFITHTV